VTSNQHGGYVVAVLGMHRSGTSALAGWLAGLGLTLPRGDLLPGHAIDNPDGYYESRELVGLNNRILRHIGHHWQDVRPLAERGRAPSPLPAELDLALDPIVDQAHTAPAALLLKDPRLCRLLPWWRAACRRRDVRLVVVLLVRSVDAVIASLARRANDPALAPAAITSHDQAAALWFRYTLEAWQHARDLPTHALAYEDFAGDRHCRQQLLDFLQGQLADWRPSGRSIDIRRARRQPAPSGWTSPRWRNPAERVYTLLAANRSEDPGGVLSGIAHALDLPIPDLDQQGEAAPLPDAIAGEALLESAFVTHPDAPRRAPGLMLRADARARPIVFVSGNPTTRSHAYRVARAVGALRANDIASGWLTPQAALTSARLLRRARCVIIHRTGADSRVQTLLDSLDRWRIPTGFDIDDLVFAPDLVRDGWLRFVDPSDSEQLDRWIRRAADLRAVLERCDFAVTPTAVLARAVARHGGPFAGPVMVRPNGHSPVSQRLSDHWRRHPLQPGDRRPRLIYASGTATHERDFAAAAGGIGAFLDCHPDWLLTIVGPLSEAGYEGHIAPQRIERRRRVDHVNLAAEFSRATVNLAPLESGNPFCDCKSPLKWFEPALVGLPTVASATPTWLEAIEPQTDGLLADEPADWTQALTRLADSPELRQGLADCARRRVIRTLTEVELMRAFERSLQQHGFVRLIA